MTSVTVVAFSHTNHTPTQIMQKTNTCRHISKEKAGKRFHIFDQFGVRAVARVGLAPTTAGDPRPSVGLSPETPVALAATPL